MSDTKQNIIEKLTPEQEALIPVVRDEWINLALRSNGKLNKQAAKEHIEFVYELSELKKPKIHFVDSPYAAQIEANLLNGNKDGKPEHYRTVCRGIGADAGWVGNYDFYTRIGLDFGEKFNRYSDTLKRSGIWD